jgi:hypothetical protein
LLPGDLLLLNNVKLHYSGRSINLIEGAEASVRHIPKYPPNFNPIEECISKIKGTLSKAKTRAVRKLLNALVKAIEKVTVDDICGWFARCGYTLSLI